MKNEVIKTMKGIVTEVQLDRWEEDGAGNDCFIRGFIRVEHDDGGASEHDRGTMANHLEVKPTDRVEVKFIRIGTWSLGQWVLIRKLRKRKIKTGQNKRGKPGLDFLKERFQ